MSFLPTIPLAGIAGWRLLERTADRQQAAFAKSPEIQRDVDYFAAKIGGVTSAADLVADRRLLKVALGAFGLEGEIDKKALLRRVLDEGTSSADALAVRLSDPAWRKLSAAFGFGDASGARTQEAGFAAKIAEAYKTRAFEAAVGATNDDLRLAMTFRREIAELAASGEKGASWYTVIGSKPLRAVMEKALGLPSSFVKLDVDKQRDILAARTAAAFGTGTLAAFRDPANVEKAIERFLARSQIESGPSASSSPVLALLSGSASSGAERLFGLLASR